MDTMKVQAQIRQNAEEVSSYLTDMSKWEKTINKQVPKRTISSDPKAAPIRPGSGTVKVIAKDPKMLASDKGSSPEYASSTVLTPASLAEMHSSGRKAALPNHTVPVARGVASLKDAETAERERGNSEYESGNFTAAIKSYTKCLGLKVRIHVN